MVESERTVLLMDTEGGLWESMLMELQGETVKRLDSSNGINKTEALETAATQTGLGGKDRDEMTATAAA